MDKIIPIKPKFIFELSFFRKLTLKERLQILIGFNIRQVLTCYAPHNPGDFSAKCDTSITKDLEPVTAPPTPTN